MKILQVCTNELAGGAAIAMNRLHSALRDAGEDSAIAVAYRQSHAPDVFLVGGKLSRGIMNSAKSYIAHRLLRTFYKRPIFPAVTSFSLFPSHTHHDINAFAKDITHLHWVNNGFLTPWSLAGLKGPVVWTMHDTWPFTGGCHYTATGCDRYVMQCGQCPELCSQHEYDLSRIHWLLKKRALRSIRPVFVSPSNALARQAQRSGMASECRIEVIPNCIDTNIFRPISKAEARSILGLPQDTPLILFGAVHATEDSNKGFDLLQEALTILRGTFLREFEVVVFGGTASTASLPCPAHFLGTLHDPVTLALAYSAVDVFVCPSRQENLPNTIMEAMACGTSVAAFSVGGIPDMVEDGVTGCLAEPENPASLAAGITRILENADSMAQFGDSAREKAVRDYSLPVVARQYISLYESTLEKHMEKCGKLQK